MPANIVIDTSAILAVLLAEPEKQAVVKATMRERPLRTSVAAVGGRERRYRRREEGAG